MSVVHQQGAEEEAVTAGGLTDGRVDTFQSWTGDTAVCFLCPADSRCWFGFIKSSLTFTE